MRKIKNFLRKIGRATLWVIGAPMPPKGVPDVSVPLSFVVTKVTRWAFQTWPETSLRHVKPKDAEINSWKDMGSVPEEDRPKIRRGARYIIEDGRMVFLEPRKSLRGIRPGPMAALRGFVMHIRYDWFRLSVIRCSRDRP